MVNGVEAEVDADVDAFVDADLWTWSRRRGCKADGRRGADPPPPSLDTDQADQAAQAEG